MRVRASWRVAAVVGATLLMFVSTQFSLGAQQKKPLGYDVVDAVGADLSPALTAPGFGLPVVDMALVAISLCWNDAARGAPAARGLMTRFSRRIYDEDMTLLQIGAPVVW